MTEPSSFAPRALLEQPADFGIEPEAVWSYASSLDEAVRLSRAIDQHVQAVAVHRLLRRGGHSMTDLASAFGERPESLAAKLRGRRPAPERDLVVWAWLTGQARRHVPVIEIAADGVEPSDLVPTLPVPARRRARASS